MQMKPSWLLVLACLVVQAKAVHAEEDIPGDFSSVAVEASDAFDFAKACMPSITESAFNRSVREAGGNAAVTTWPADKTKPFMAVTRGRVFCVKRSSHGNPVMPLVAFDDTITFPEMAKDEARRLHSDLSRQLAAVGFASALVVNDSGNAYQVAYMFNSDRPTRLYYRAGFLKKGEFDERQSAGAYRASGGLTISARGQGAEHYKPLYQ